MKFLIGFLILSTIGLNQICSFNLPLKGALLDENEMFSQDSNKEVSFLQRVYPSEKIKSIGQVGGVDTDIDGNLIVFHRGNRVWSFDSFFGNKFNAAVYKPIENDVLDLIDHKTLKKIDSWGANKFYMPHGLTLDYEGNIWLTDVGAHQVYKYNLAKNQDQPQLVLGEQLVNGNDEKHFCKPTSIAVSELTGEIFVADGYCNSRVVRFDKLGNFIGQYEDKENPLQVVHSAALIEKLNLICTVSRQEGRIVCFDISSRKKAFDLKDSTMKTVYAIEYDPLNEVIHAVTGPNNRVEAEILTFDARKDSFGELLKRTTSDNIDISEAHDIAISPDGSRIYVGQMTGEIDEFIYDSAF